jgi:hypothetical protein
MCCDAGQVYVTADGILRAFDLRGGGLQWERYLGASTLNWRSCVRGATVIAYPDQPVPRGVDGRLTVCEATSGRYVQRLQLPADAGPVQVYPTAHTTLVASGGTLWGLK